MGVSVVRGLGSRLSRARPDAGGSGFRETAAQVDVARTLHAPEWSDSCVRVEFWRCQSAGACMGDYLHLPAGEGAERRGRYEVAEELLPEAAPELHLVG